MHFDTTSLKKNFHHAFFQNFPLLKAAMLAAVIFCGYESSLSAKESFPDHPIQMIVPTVPGGSIDILMRDLMQLASPLLGQPISILNKAGASGMIGVSAVTHAKPDGYTIGGVWSGPITMAPHVGPANYKPTDYTMVTMVSAASGVMCVSPKFPANNGREFLEELRKHPDKYSYGADGVGGFVRFATERVFNAADVHARMIPYAGASEIVNAFLGGIVDIYGGALATVLPFAKQGKAKCLLLTSANRSTLLPDIDSLSDVGYASSQTLVWHGIIAPANVPEDRLAKLRDAFQKVIAEPSFKKFAESLGEEPWTMSAAEANKFTTDEYNTMGELAKKIGFKDQN
jgi:tripartite-type tricarboxylate transporter receptor subunit TctC